MNTNNQLQGLLPALGAAADGLITLSRWLLPYAVRFGREALDGAMAAGRSLTIAASLWMIEAGRRFWDWCEDPQNKVRVNRAMNTIAASGNRAFECWCWAITATIEAGYHSRPYADRAMAWGRKQTEQFVVLTHFLWGLREWLLRFDFEEVEHYQLALPYSPPVALLAPALVNGADGSHST